MDDPLIGAAAERKIRIAKLSHKRAVHNRIKIRKNHAEALISKDFLISKTGIAPDGLAGFFL